MNEHVVAQCLKYTGVSDGNICKSHENFKILHSVFMHLYCTYVLVAKSSALFCYGITNNSRSNLQNNSVFQGLRLFSLS